jgi:hypothetical protein
MRNIHKEIQRMCPQDEDLRECYNGLMNLWTKLHSIDIKVYFILTNFVIVGKYIYSQTRIKRSHLGKSKSSLLRQVTSYKKFVLLRFSMT